MDNMYKIEGSTYYNAPIDTPTLVYPDFQNQLTNFKTTLKNQVKNGLGISYYKFGDGDYFFLKKKVKVVPNRAIEL